MCKSVVVLGWRSLKSVNLVNVLAPNTFKCFNHLSVHLFCCIIVSNIVPIMKYMHDNTLSLRRLQGELEFESFIDLTSLLADANIILHQYLREYLTVRVGFAVKLTWPSYRFVCLTTDMKKASSTDLTNKISLQI